MSSINDLEQELDTARQELESNIKALSDYVNPQKTAKRVKSTALNKAAQMSNKATNIIERAQAGDLESLKVLAAAAGISIFGVLMLLRKLFK